MIDFDRQRTVMQKPFDIQTHKRTFVDYLEIVLDENGDAHYAVPSHQMWLRNYAAKKLHLTQEELSDRCPMAYWCDVTLWLTKITGCVAVWDVAYVGTLNSKQKAMLELLQLEGLYKGKIV